MYQRYLFSFLKWYGMYNYPKTCVTVKERTAFKRLQKKTRFWMKNSTCLYFYRMDFYLPPSWDLIFIDKSKYGEVDVLYVYLYNVSHFFIFPLAKKFVSIKHDISVKSLGFQFMFKNNYFNLFWNHFKILFYSFSKMFYTKLKFRGKGYYIYRNARNTIALRYGYTHLYYLYSSFISIQFMSKVSLVSKSVTMFGINPNDILKSACGFYNVRRISIFNGKGIRFARQIIYRKTGKVSAYR